MSTVYIVQELRKFVCPECGHWRLDRRVVDAHYEKGQKSRALYQCKSCHSEFYEAATAPKHDVTPARAYGELKVLISRNNIGIAMAPLVADLRSKLRNYSDEDYLLTIGDPIAIGAATAVAANMNRGRVNLLKWDRQTRQYIVAELNLSPKRDALESKEGNVL